MSLDNRGGAGYIDVHIGIHNVAKKKKKNSVDLVRPSREGEREEVKARDTISGTGDKDGDESTFRVKAIPGQRGHFPSCHTGCRQTAQASYFSLLASH